MITVTLTREERDALMLLLDMAVRAQGLRVAAAAQEIAAKFADPEPQQGAEG